MKKLIGTIVAVALAFCAQVAAAHGDGKESDDEAWARIAAQNDADFEAGRLLPDKGQSTLEKHDVVSESSGGGGKGTGTKIGYIGYYPERKGVILVTNDRFGGIVSTGHAGIVYSTDVTVEAIDEGVKRLPNKWYIDKSQAFGLTVRGTTRAQDRAAAEWANKQVGKEYNFDFANVDRRDKFYCAHLVWAAFKDLYGIDLNLPYFKQAIHPMELAETDLTRLVYQMRP